MTSSDPGHRLATYGTLAPGRANADQLEGIQGKWSLGRVRGHLKAAGWGAQMGFPGLILDPNGPEVEVHLLHSKDLPDHWSRLDAFEGPGYARVAVPIETDAGTVVAFIYALAD
ncbi:gamma-glutamylcyclotransferase family protein [uncultured Tateyamaria sp.]|uniref:gamma-glutamylcyclotransferase family protein n=1 Tax=uncultured Tateyamaria sp. TaxID=455651 RepID=UPI0026222D28|nr:gamma-glutamylcyclotransferase family protein [uncultured Tateyamaria sp.]